MVNQIAELQKRICSLEQDIEVVLLHVLHPDAVTLQSDNTNISSIIEKIKILHKHQFTVEYSKRFIQAVDKLPIDAESKGRFHKYVNEGVGNKDCTEI